MTKKKLKKGIGRDEKGKPAIKKPEPKYIGQCSECREKIDEKDTCLNCGNEAKDWDVDEVWCSNDGHFCSMECCALWFAGQGSIEEIDEDEGDD